MARWMKPKDELPVCYIGDRVVGIVRYRDLEGGPMLPHVVVLEATEYGWDDVQGSGFDIGDCELWTLESDLVRIADDISGEPAALAG